MIIKRLQFQLLLFHNQLKHPSCHTRSSSVSSLCPLGFLSLRHQKQNSRFPNWSSPVFTQSADGGCRARESSLFHNLTFSYIHLSLWNSFFGDARWAPGIIVIANPDIIELQSDRATPGAARTITLRPGSQWKSCIREKKPQSIRCWKTGKCWQIMCQYQPK